jgi:Protein of unknown function (DUF2721)
MDLIPDAAQLSNLMSLATALAFVLGAVAAFVAVLLSRMTTVIERIRSLNEIATDDTARAHLKSDIPRLRQRAKLVNNAIHLALASGFCTSLAPGRGSVSAFLRLRHEYGARPSFRCSDCPTGWVALQVRTGGENGAQRDRSFPMRDEQRRSSMRPLYDARIRDLGHGDFVRPVGR